MVNTRAASNRLQPSESGASTRGCGEAEDAETDEEVASALRTRTILPDERGDTGVRGDDDKTESHKGLCCLSVA